MLSVFLKQFYKASKPFFLLTFGLIWVFLLSNELQVTAFGNNVTNNITIETNKTQDNLLLTYYITQTFVETESRGVFLTLPQNQDGVWTNYTIKSVEISDKIDLNEQYNPTLNQFQSTSYDQIKEWNQFRLRVGDENKTIEIGTYTYKIIIDATTSSQLSYKFTTLADWGDKIDSANVFVDGKDLCKESGCGQNFDEIATTINPQKERTPILNILGSILNTIWAYLVLGTLTYIFIYILWLRFARDAGRKGKIKSPSFEPPQTSPWNAEFLINEGRVDLKNTLLSYILWLNHKQYIALEPVIDNDPIDTKETKGILNIFDTKVETDKIKLEILKDLPTDLPEIFNQTIEKISIEGMQKGLLSSQINPGTHGGMLNRRISKILNDYYSIKPLASRLEVTSLEITSFCGIVGFVLVLVIYGLLKENTLLGESFMVLLLINIALSIPGFYWLFKYWGKLNENGLKLYIDCERYKYYLKKAEIKKLDFSNNPDEGVQYYLAAVPFAAAFGILPQFQEYITKLIPEAYDQIWLTDSFTRGYLATSFYAPVSDTSSGGDGGSSGGFSGGGGSW